MKNTIKFGIIVLFVLLIVLASSAAVKDSAVQIKSGGKTTVITTPANGTVNNTNVTIPANDSIQTPAVNNTDADKKPKIQNNNTSKTAKNPVSNTANMLVKLINRMSNLVNGTSKIGSAEKRSILGELDVLLSRANEIKQKADALTQENIKKSNIVKDYKSTIKDIKKILKNIRKQMGTEPVQYDANASIEQRCPDNYGLSSDTVLIYYTDEPHSNKMILIAGELETEGYSFYKTNDLWNQKQGRCFDVVGITPTFVCVGSKERLVGEVSKDELKAFAANCANS